MFKELSGETELSGTGLSGKRWAMRAVTGFAAGVVGTYLTRVLVRIYEIWPVFHTKSFGPLLQLLSQDDPLMVKACLIAGVIFGIFFMIAPRSLGLSVVGAVLLMNALVFVGRVYMAGGLEPATQAGALPIEAFVRATLRGALIIAVYWPLHALFVKRAAAAH
jgi:hypothetical protein